MFTSTVELKNVPFTTFEEAFRDFFTRIKTMIAGGTSWQVLETSCWIEYLNEETNKRIPALFYDARDIAYHVGLLAGEGELQELAHPIPIEKIREEFSAVAKALENDFRNKVLRHMAETLTPLREVIDGGEKLLESPDLGEELHGQLAEALSPIREVVGEIEQFVTSSDNEKVPA